MKTIYTINSIIIINNQKDFQLTGHSFGIVKVPLYSFFIILYVRLVQLETGFLGEKKLTSGWVLLFIIEIPIGNVYRSSILTSLCSGTMVAINQSHV